MEQIHGDLPQHSSNNSKYQQRNINSMLEKKNLKCFALMLLFARPNVISLFSHI